LPNVHTAAGNTVWYGGGKLAADLTWPKIRERWAPPVAHATSAAGPLGCDRSASNFTCPSAAEERARTGGSRSFTAAPGASAGSTHSTPWRDQVRQLSPEQRRMILAGAIREARAAGADLRRLLVTYPAAASAIAYAAADTLTSAARIVEGPRGGPLT